MQVDMNALVLFAGAGTYAAKRLLDPSLEFLGEKLRHLWLERAAEAESVTNEAKRILDERGLDVVPVPGRILWRILEHASADTTAAMRSRWTAMLANASAHADLVPVEFPQILAQLSVSDATILENMADRIVAEGHKYTANQRLSEISDAVESVDELRRALTNLERLMLVVPSETNSAFDNWDDEFMLAEKGVRLTRYGIQFIMACRPPESPNLIEKNAPHPQG